MSKLTIIEIGAEARRRGLDEFADWIISEGTAREEAEQAEANKPFETPGGLIYPGRWYNLTYLGRVYGSGPAPKKTAKNVKASAVHSYAGAASRTLLIGWYNYKTRDGNLTMTRNMQFWRDEINRIIAVEEVPEPV